ncbi:hypothetical protein JW992_00210, partial [candidate division KSB1 bacterium]|nr:hypothetical protein [candidate division KSB1 bacterium]
MRSARKSASPRPDTSLQIALILAAVTVFAFAHRLVRVPLSAAAVAVALLVFALLVLFLVLQHGKSARHMLYSRLDSRREPAVIAGFVILVVLVTVYAAVTRQLTPSLLVKTTAVLGLPTLAVWGLRR